MAKTSVSPRSDPAIKDLVAALRPAHFQHQVDDDADDGRRLSLCRLPEVMAMTGLSRPSIYAMKARGEFPESIDLGARSVAWVKSEVEGWIADQIRKSRMGRIRRPESCPCGYESGTVPFLRQRQPQV
jgi:prophage regulatory protein